MLTGMASEHGTEGRAAAAGGVQSIERAFDILEGMADAGGEVTLTELVSRTGLPMPTIHRVMRTLVDRGYVRQEPSRRYALAPRLIRLGESASRLLNVWVRPHLASLVDALGETANMALLDGDQAVYVAQAPSRHSMRTFTEVGRRVLPHCTGVGKALLAQLDPAEAREILARTGMPAQTPRTITDPARLLRELAQVRRRGYAIDAGEQEIGVQCIAVPVPDAPALAAISVSGPEARLTPSVVERAVPLLQEVARRVSTELTYDDATA
jgi:IclR family transcriptional regulator, acetate operon repressor